MKQKTLKTAIALSALMITGELSAATPTPPSPPITAKVVKDKTGKAAQSISYKIPFKKGWTLFGVPGYKAYKANDILGDKSSVDIIYYYDNRTGGWQLFQPGRSDGTINALVPGVGYWVNSTKPFVAEFKSNIVTSRSVYEKAAILKSKDGENIDDASLLPPMPVETASYEDTWNESGEFEDDFNADAGTTDWTKRDPKNFSESDWDEDYRFDPELLVDWSFEDVSGLIYRFTKAQGKSYKEIKVAIASKKKNGKLQVRASGSSLITSKGHLTIAYKAGKSVKKVTFQLLDIDEKDGGGVILKMKNIATKKPVKWTAKEIYDPETKTWSDATVVLASDASSDDIDVSNTDWDNLDATSADDALAEVDDDSFESTCTTEECSDEIEVDDDIETDEEDEDYESSSSSSSSEDDDDDDDEEDSDDDNDSSSTSSDTSSSTSTSTDATSSSATSTTTDTTSSSSTSTSTDATSSSSTSTATDTNTSV